MHTMIFNLYITEDIADFKIMEASLIFTCQILKRTIITLQALKLKLKSPNQTCISSKTIM